MHVLFLSAETALTQGQSSVMYVTVEMSCSNAQFQR